jgi:hypothetical protein
MGSALPLNFWTLQGADYSPKVSLIAQQNKLIVARYGDAR